MNEFQVKDSGERINYQSGMRRDTQKGKPNFRLIDLGFLKRLAEHLTKGAEKYGRDNWRLANSQEELDRFMDSSFRHLMQWLNGETDEDHGMAVCFNIMAAEHTKAKMKETPTKNHQHSPKFVDIVGILDRFSREVLDHPRVRFDLRDKGMMYLFTFEWNNRHLRYLIDPSEFDYSNVDTIITHAVSEINGKYMDAKIGDILGNVFNRD